MQPNVQRIGILDSFRFFAILLVIGFHYFVRFATEQIYPYGDQYADFFLFKYGDLGVKFFFMISGFVIFMTLEKSQTFSTFLLKRAIRLYPALVLCSLIIFLAVPLLDAGQQQPYFHRPFANFIPSLTFIDPFLWTMVWTDITGFIDGVHWSLIVEVKFYIIAGALYFLKKEKGLEHWMGFVSGVSALLILLALCKEYHLVKAAFLKPLDMVLATFLLKDHLIYFTAGIFFFALYSKKKMNKGTLLGFGFSSIYFLSLMDGVDIAFLAFFILLFLGFIYRPRLLKVFQVPLISRIGLISYPLYLIHQNLGVLLINKLPLWFNFEGTFGVAVFVMVLMMVMAYFLDKYFDLPSQKILSYLFFKRQRGGVKEGSWLNPLYVTKRFLELYVGAIKSTTR